MANEPEIPPPSQDDVLWRKEQGVFWITLNRPVVLNAINWSVMTWLMKALDQAEWDDEVKAIVLHGAGRAFSAGGDLRSTPPPPGTDVPRGMDVYMKIWQMQKPVVAAVHGYALGQGCEMAGVCDITIAAESAQFGEVQIRHGFLSPVLITPFLAGLKQAKELLLLGEMVDAREAQRLGLVNRVVPNEDLLAEAEKVALRLASLPEQTVRINKVLVNRVYELAGFYRALDYGDDPLVRALRTGGADLNEHLKVLREQGWEAFRQSRDASYKEPG